MIRQLLTESVLLAMLAAGAGLVVATWAWTPGEVDSFELCPNQQNIGIMHRAGIHIGPFDLDGVIFGLHCGNEFETGSDRITQGGCRGATSGSRAAAAEYAGNFGDCAVADPPARGGCFCL